MKRWFAIAALLVAGALAGRAVYSAARPVSEQACTMEWLSEELKLSEDQAARIERLHAQSNGPLQKLRSEYAQCDKARAGGARVACENATQQLIDQVSAELNPEQRAKYLNLVAPCARGGARKP